MKLTQLKFPFHPRPRDLDSIGLACSNTPSIKPVLLEYGTMEIGAWVRTEQRGLNNRYRMAPDATNPMVFSTLG